MKKLFFCGSFALMALVTSCDKDNDDNDLNSTDHTFMTQVAIGNNAEIMAGNLAATKGNDPAVRAFGQMMVTEHGLAKNDLQDIASDLGRNLPDTVDAEHQALMVYLNSLSGYSFDTAYMNSQVRDHLKTLNIFQMELSGGQHQRVRNYAQNYLPHIQMHYHKADSLARAL